MVTIFNLLGRIISTSLGLVVLCLGIVWTLQAFDLAFNTPMVPGGPVSFMVNNHRWAIYGAILAVRRHRTGRLEQHAARVEEPRVPHGTRYCAANLFTLRIALDQRKEGVLPIENPYDCSSC